MGGVIKKFGASLDYLVVGVHRSDAWKHGKYGQKINKAVRWRESGKKIAIVCERHWARSIARLAA